MNRTFMPWKATWQPLVLKKNQHVSLTELMLLCVIGYVLRHYYGNMPVTPKYCRTRTETNSTSACGHDAPFWKAFPVCRAN